MTSSCRQHTLIKQMAKLVESQGHLLSYSCTTVQGLIETLGSMVIFDENQVH